MRLPDVRPRGLAGKVAVVTGGTAGIGAATSRLLAAEGASIVVVSRGVAQPQDLASGVYDAAVVLVTGDVADVDTSIRAVETTLKRFGRLDILVNNAAIDYSDTSLVDTPPEDAQRVFAVNALGAFFMLQQAARAMRETGGGSIVNVASRAGVVGIPQMGVYGATKAAVIGLTRAAAVELAPYGIRVNAVAPGPTETPLMRTWIDSQDNPAEFEASLTSTLFDRRLARPEEVANAILYLATEASSFVTGVCLPVDGGYTAA